MTPNPLKNIFPGLSHIPSIHKSAYVPEHSVELMRVLSGGEPFICEDYLYFTEDEWLMGIGYPLAGTYCQKSFQCSLNKAIKVTKPHEIWVACPQLPSDFKRYLVEKDVFYTLDPEGKFPSRLMNLAGRAAESLRIDVSRDFTEAHHNLWNEFLASRTMTSRVLKLYTSTQKALQVLPEVMFLNAWDKNSNLASCLLLDFAPEKFSSYILGAHSRLNYVPYATDLLFREMINLSRKYNKEFIHLGLGVNPGITRFKRKWGAKKYQEYELARLDNIFKPVRAVMPNTDIMQNKTRYLLSLPEQRNFKMLWKVTKNQKTSWIGGSAHFSYYSFKYSLGKLFNNAETIIFEGPLGKVSMAYVDQMGKNPGPGANSLIKLMDEQEINNLKKVVQGPDNFWLRLLNSSPAGLPDVRYYLSRTRPWMAFYGLWSGFLKRIGWEQSVDMEAWNLAKDRDKCVMTMENIEDQVKTLESIPVERIIHFFKDCKEWKKMAQQNKKAYLKGDLESMFGTSTEFPTRTRLVINRRDELFLRQMLPHMNRGRCVVLVGTAHMFNLRHMLRDAGFKVEKVR
ncbi:MAG: TraB/GumN family protein [Desulfonatronovibrio sp.]